MQSRIRRLKEKGLLFALLAPLFYACKSAAVKFAPPAKVEFLVFFRFFFDFLWLSPLFFRYRRSLSSQQLPLHLLRGLFVAASIYCSIYGIRHLALVDAVLLENTLPLFVPLVIWIWHGQKISPFCYFILGLGFVSLCFLLNPKGDVFHWASLFSLATGLLAAITAVSIRQLAKTDSPITILFYFNLFAGLAAIGPCLYTWEGSPPLSLAFWWPLALVSLCGVLFQYAITKAYSLIPSHVAGGFSYFGVLFSALFGFFIWGEALEWSQIAGGILLILAGILMMRESARATQIGAGHTI